MALLASLVTVEEVVKKGDQLIRDGTIEVKEKKIIPYHCNLAPSYGTLRDADSFKLMDDQLKIIIGVTSRKLSDMIQDAQEKGETVSWDSVVSAMSTNVCLEPMDATITRSEKLIKNDMNYFKVSGSPDPNTVREVHTWFTNLIQDDDVLQDTKIDINSMGNIVAQSGATITSFETFVYKKEYHETEVMDIGVLRFPDIDHPYFKVYRIQLTAWSDCTRIAFVQHDSNGITGNYNARKYKPRESVIEKISKEAKEKAVKAAEEYILSM